jgi:hypothetical protein
MVCAARDLVIFAGPRTITAGHDFVSQPPPMVWPLVMSCKDGSSFANRWGAKAFCSSGTEGQEKLQELILRLLISWQPYEQ